MAILTRSTARPAVRGTAAKSEVVVSVGALLFCAAGAAAAPLLIAAVWGTNPTEQNLMNSYASWFSPGHPLGTDDLGRDVLARLAFAGRVSLGVAFSAAIMQVLLGTGLGLLAGFLGGRVDDAVHLLYQIVSTIPQFFLLVALASLTRPNAAQVVLVLGALGWTGLCRQIRGQVFTLREHEFVTAARAVGASNARIMLLHVLPNLGSTVLVVGTFDVSAAILAEAGLSFLGLGIQPPTPSWGNMLSGALDGFGRAPWLIVAPGGCILLTLLCVYWLGDALRDLLDPNFKTLT